MVVYFNSTDAGGANSRMPTISIEGYKLRFYSSDRFEPPHVHVLKGGNEAKIWLQPIEVERNYGFNPVELNRIVRLTHRNQPMLLETWNVYFAR